MGAFKSAVITNKGQALMAKVLAGSTVFDFTKICTSATQYSESTDLASLTNIGTIKQTSLVASVLKVSDTSVKVSTQFVNTSLSTGYYVRVLGLYAIDPTDGEILYAVAVADESVATADYMPPYNNIGSSSLLVDMVTTVGNASSVTVEVDPSAVATVTQINYLQDQIEDVKGYIGYTSSDIYGVEVDYVTKTFKRLAGAENLTAGANFDSIAPWGRYRCIVTDTGIELAKYGEAGYTETGATTVEITKNSVVYPAGTKVQVMVRQPKFYQKIVPLSMSKSTSGRGLQVNKARYYVSPVAKAGFKVNPIFIADNGIEQDYIYLSAFEGSLYDTSASAYITDDAQIADFTATTGDLLCSRANVKPISGLTQNLTRANTRTLATNRGAGWRLHSIFALAVTQILFLVEYASMDMQAKIGIGVSNKTDDGASNMAENTGGTSSLGNASGAVVNANGFNTVSYRGEENLYGNIWTWLDGINIEAKSIHNAYLNSTGANIADDTKTNYNEAGFPLSKANGYISKFGYSEEFDYLFLPTENTGASNLPVGDYFYQNYTYNGFMVARLGGSWTNGSPCGAWCLSVDVASSFRARSIGGRLLYVPQGDRMEN